MVPLNNWGFLIKPNTLQPRRCLVAVGVLHFRLASAAFSATSALIIRQQASTAKITELKAPSRRNFVLPWRLALDVARVIMERCLVRKVSVPLEAHFGCGCGICPRRHSPVKGMTSPSFQLSLKSFSSRAENTGTAATLQLADLSWLLPASQSTASNYMPYMLHKL